MRVQDFPKRFRGYKLDLRYRDTIYPYSEVFAERENSLGVKIYCRATNLDVLFPLVKTKIEENIEFRWRKRKHYRFKEKNGKQDLREWFLC